MLKNTLGWIKKTYLLPLWTEKYTNTAHKLCFFAFFGCLSWFGMNAIFTASDTGFASYEGYFKEYVPPYNQQQYLAILISGRSGQPHLVHLPEQPDFRETTVRLVRLTAEDYLQVRVYRSRTGLVMPGKIILNRSEVLLDQPDHYLIQIEGNISASLRSINLGMIVLMLICLVIPILVPPARNNED